MSRENENPLEALVQDFYKGIETKLQAKTGWGRNDVLDVVRDVQVSVLARHLARAVGTPKRRPVAIGRGAIYMLDTSAPTAVTAPDDPVNLPWEDED